MPKLAGRGLSGALGSVVGAAKSVPTRIGNARTQAKANFGASSAAQAVPKLTPEQAHAKAMSTPAPAPAPAPAAPAHAAPAAPAAPAAAPAPKSIGDTLSSMTGRHAAGLGAAALALKGWVDPGTYVDENGNTQQKSRLNSALSGAVTGAGAGLLAAPLIRGGARAHMAHAASSQPAPATHAPVPAPARPAAPVHPELPDLTKPKTSSVVSSPVTPPLVTNATPAGGAPAAGNGIASGKTAGSDDMSKEKAKEVTDPELNPESDKKLPYKVPSIKLKK